MAKTGVSSKQDDRDQSVRIRIPQVSFETDVSHVDCLVEEWHEDEREEKPEQRVEEGWLQYDEKRDEKEKKKERNADVVPEDTTPGTDTRPVVTRSIAPDVDITGPKGREYVTSSSRMMFSSVDMPPSREAMTKIGVIHPWQSLY